MANGHVAADQLRLLIERIERLEEEKKGVADDIKDVYAEAKANGYDTKTMRTIVKLRKMEKAQLDEMDALESTYRAAIGLGEKPCALESLRDAASPKKTPLEAAVEKANEIVNAGALDRDGGTVRATVIDAG